MRCLFPFLACVVASLLRRCRAGLHGRVLFGAGPRRTPRRARSPRACPALPCPLPLAAGMATDAFEEFVVGHGELWCAQLTAAKCRQLGADCAFMDTRDVLVVRGRGMPCQLTVDVPVSEGSGSAFVPCRSACGAHASLAFRALVLFSGHTHRPASLGGAPVGMRCAIGDAFGCRPG